ncbi:unnamed protein product [Closterium sp. Naga37s-1]|nr:unnamed protein product [Closterium sp. Naga37s-1]
MDWSDRGSDTRPLFAPSSPRSPKRFGAFSRSRSSKERERSRIRRSAYRFDGLGSFERLDWDRLKEFEKGRLLGRQHTPSQLQQATTIHPHHQHHHQQVQFQISPRESDAARSPPPAENPPRPISSRTDSAGSLDAATGFYLPHPALAVPAAVADPAGVPSAGVTPAATGAAGGLLTQPGGEFSWFHVEIPRSCPSLSAAARQLITHLHPPLQLQEITTLLSNGPYCGTLGGALFVRINSPGPMDSPYTFKIAARITPFGIVSVALGPVPRLELQREPGGLLGSEVGLGLAGLVARLRDDAAPAAGANGVGSGGGAGGAAAGSAIGVAAAVGVAGSASSLNGADRGTDGATVLRRRSPNASFRAINEGEPESAALSVLVKGTSATVTPQTSTPGSPSDTPRPLKISVGAGSSSLEASAIAAVVAGGATVRIESAAAPLRLLHSEIEECVTIEGGSLSSGTIEGGLPVSDAGVSQVKSEGNLDQRGLLQGLGSRSFGLGSRGYASDAGGGGVRWGASAGFSGAGASGVGSAGGGASGDAGGVGGKRSGGVLARVGKVLEAMTPRRREVREQQAEAHTTIDVDDAELEELLRKSHPENAECLIPVTVFGLLQHIVETHMEHLEDVVVEVECMLDQHERDLDEGSDYRLRLLKDRTFPKLHLDLQRVLQSLAHGEVVLPKLKDRLVARHWCAGPVASAVLDGAMARLRRGKENVGFLTARITALQTGLDQWQSEQINKKLYYISFLSIVFLPLSIITGAFGMNVGGVPWVQQTTNDPNITSGFINVMWICFYVVIALGAAFAAPSVYAYVQERLEERKRIGKELWERARKGDVLSLIATSVASKCASAAEFASLRLSCTRFHDVATFPEVLSALPISALTCPARAYSASYRSFLRACADARNNEAAFLLGMIEFYCLGDRKDGIKHLVQAAKAGHPGALHSLAVVHFNGSGGAVPERKLSVGVLLCASAAQQGHVAALRELGHCLQDGYGIKKNVAEGRRLLMEANLREFAASQVLSGEGGFPEAEQKLRQLDAVIKSVKAVIPKLSADEARSNEQGQIKESRAQEHVSAHDHAQEHSHAGPCNPPSANGASSPAQLLQSLCRCLRPLMSDFGCAVPDLPLPPASRFLLEWNAEHGVPAPEGGLKVCGNVRCGRPETREKEFRCCAVCSGPSYCSRACQALDWRAGHMDACQEAPSAEDAVQLGEGEAVEVA